MHPLPNGPRVDLPEPVLAFAFGMYFRTIIMPKDLVVTQHDHAYPHPTLVGFGRVRGWKNGVCMGDKGPGEVFEVEAGAKHAYQALELSVLSCVHNEESETALKAKGR